VFSFSLRGHQQNVSLSSGLSYEGTGKSRMVQGRVNWEDEELISLTENKTSRTLCCLLSAIIKIAELPNRHLGKKPQQQ